MGLQMVNRFCILVMWENTTTDTITQMSMVLGLLMVNRFRILKT